MSSNMPLSAFDNITEDAIVGILQSGVLQEDEKLRMNIITLLNLEDNFFDSGKSNREMGKILYEGLEEKARKFIDEGKSPPTRKLSDLSESSVTLIPYEHGSRAFQVLTLVKKLSMDAEGLVETEEIQKALEEKGVNSAMARIAMKGVAKDILAKKYPSLEDHFVVTMDADNKNPLAWGYGE